MPRGSLMRVSSLEAGTRWSYSAAARVRQLAASVRRSPAARCEEHPPVVSLQRGSPIDPQRRAPVGSYRPGGLRRIRRTVALRHVQESKMSK
jgi:hypothetical protein